MPLPVFNLHPSGLGGKLHCRGGGQITGAGRTKICGPGNGNPPVRSRGKAPVGGLGDEKLKPFDKSQMKFLAFSNTQR